jgi:hypothetical protein
MEHQPKTGERCHCKRGAQRDNCPDCEGTGWRIDFAAIRKTAGNLLRWRGAFRSLRAEEEDDWEIK